MSKLTINSALPMNSGYKIPQLGFGVYQTPADVAETCVLHAFSAGYRHVDSAAAYHNEGPCASAIIAASTSSKANSTPVPRSDIFFTSKVPPRSISYDSAKSQVATTLKITGLEYIDLMLLHAPYGGREGRKGAWKALVEAKREGKVRSIGISNYGIPHLKEWEDYTVELATEEGASKSDWSEMDVGQWEVHPWLPRRDIVAWCQAHKVVVEAYCPVVRGTRFDEPVVKKLSEKHGKTPAQILLRWSLQKGFVPLPKSVTPARIVENADLYGFEISEGDMKSLEFDAYEPVAWDPSVSGLEK